MKEINFIEIKESELKEITLFLIDKKIIFHPNISPNGVPDFSRYPGRKFVLILDRNILVPLIRLVKEGELKDSYSLKVVSSILLWSQFNNIAVTSGLALSEYAHFHKGNEKASLENNIFLRIFEQYSPKIWLELSLRRRRTIPKIKDHVKTDFEFYKEDDHFKMHYLEMLKIAQLYFDSRYTIEEKFKKYHQWVYDNILICKYTTSFAAILFGGKSKTLNGEKRDFNEVVGKCKNQAWDLTYLSFWSTLYYYEDESDDIYLLATLDKELKEVFVVTHSEAVDIYRQLFGEKVGDRIVDNLTAIYLPREKPEIDSKKLDKMIDCEKLVLEEVLRN